MEVPRDIAVYGGRMLAEIFFSPRRGRVCVYMYTHRIGRAAEQGTATCCVCVSRGKDDPAPAGYPAERGWPQVKMRS